MTTNKIYEVGFGLELKLSDIKTISQIKSSNIAKSTSEQYICLNYEIEFHKHKPLIVYLSLPKGGFRFEAKDFKHYFECDNDIPYDERVILFTDSQKSLIREFNKKKIITTELVVIQTNIPSEEQIQKTSKLQITELCCKNSHSCDLLKDHQCEMLTKNSYGCPYGMTTISSTFNKNNKGFDKWFTYFKSENEATITTKYRPASKTAYVNNFVYINLIPMFLHSEKLPLVNDSFIKKEDFTVKLIADELIEFNLKKYENTSVEFGKYEAPRLLNDIKVMDEKLYSEIIDYMTQPTLPKVMAKSILDAQEKQLEFISESLLQEQDYAPQLVQNKKEFYDELYLKIMSELNKNKTVEPLVKNSPKPLL